MTACLTTLLSLALAPALAAAPLAYTAEYEVLRNGQPLGRAAVTVATAGGDAWTMRSETRGTRGVAALAGVEITERSSFRWTGERLEAIEYDYRQRAATRSRERSVRVDPEAGRIRSVDRDRETVLPYLPGVLDRHILPLAIASDVGRDGAARLEYRVAERGEVAAHEYRVTGHERVETAAGPVDALRVDRIRSDSGRVTTLWLDPARGHVPVRVVQSEGRDTMETRLLAFAR